MTMLQLQPPASGGTDRTALLPALRAGAAAGTSGRPPRRKVGFGRVRVSDWGYRLFRVY